MENRLSSRAYARHRKSRGLRGATQRTVIDAIRDGRLTTRSVCRDVRGHWSINPEIVDQEWSENTIAHNSPQPRSTDLPSRAQSQARKEAALARMAELDLQVKQGTLVEIEEVEAKWFTRGRQIRDAMEAIPARVIERLVAEIGEVGRQQQASIRLILEGEIKVALENLSRSMKGGGAA